MARNFSLLGLSAKADNTVTFKVLDMKPYTEFGIAVDDPTICTLTNNESPIDAIARLSYMSEDVARVSHGMKLSNGKVDPAVHVTVKYEDVIRETDSADSSVIIDHPITAQFSFRAPKISSVTSAMLKQMASAVLGSILTSTGSDRFDDLVRSALRPKAD